MTTTISANDLALALRGALPPQLIDVRRKPALDESGKIIVGASWRNPDDIENWMHDIDASLPVVVYCVHGRQVSQTCALHLAEAGFTVSYLDGGFEGWLASDLPITVHP